MLTEPTHNRKVARKRILTVTAVAVLIALSFGIGYFLAIGTIKQPSQGILVTDDIGRKVYVPQQVERIVSLAPSNTEILFALDLGNNLVGVDDNSDYPEEAKNKTIVGGYGGFNLELIVSLNPDLILGAGITSEQLIFNLEKSGLSVVVLNPQTIDGVMGDIRLVGLICGNLEKAEDIVSSFQERIENVIAKTSNESLYRPKVYLEIDDFLFTFGPSTFGNDLIFMAGGRNIAANATISYPRLSNEYIIGSNPEIIIFMDSPWITTTPESIKNRTGWTNIEAVKNNRISSIDDDLVSRPGPRIVDGLEEMARLIHPELFP